MWEWLTQLLSSGSGAEALAGELAMKAAPDMLLNSMPLNAGTPPAPVTSWDSVVNPATAPMQLPAAPNMMRPDIMPMLPGNGFVTMNPPSAAPAMPGDHGAPGYGPSTTAPIVPEITPTAPSTQPRPSMGLTPEQMMAMMKMMDGGQQQAPRAGGGGGGSAARPPNQVVMGAPMAASRQSLADLLKLRR